jgi:hypothetical protein
MLKITTKHTESKQNSFLSFLTFIILNILVTKKKKKKYDIIFEVMLGDHVVPGNMKKLTW